MFKALMGGGRSSSDVRSSSGSKSGSRRKTGSKSSASSTVSRKSSSRGDDRDRGLGDLSAYQSPGGRSKRYADSAADESVASSYATAQPNYSDDRVVIERAPKQRESGYDEREDRYREERDRDRKGDGRRERERTRSEREDSRDRDSRRRERERTQSGDSYLPPLASGAISAPGPAPLSPPTTQDPAQSPFPITPMSGPHDAPSPSIYDPHVQQQFPGQFPDTFAEPYRPPNPAGEAADYYGDQGQSVADQPGVRPKPPLVIPNSQAHLMTASPSSNPPPEPSSVGGVGAAAAYFTDDPGLHNQYPEQPVSGPESRPPKPSKPSRPSAHAGVLGATAAAATAAATYGVGNYSSEQPLTESPSSYVPHNSSNTNKPPQSHSHGVGTVVGAAAVGAAASYTIGHHQHSSSASDHVSQYTMQNPDDVSQVGPGYSGPSTNPALYAAGAAGAAGAAYASSPLHPDHAAIYHGSPFQGGGLAFQQRQRGPLDKFIDFWRDPDGVGRFEDYTEAIGVCKYCFEPGTTSKDAPRTHHYGRRRSSDRISAGSRVEKLSRYASSEDEGRRRKSSKSSWLPAILGGYAVKSLFDNKDFDDSYSVRSGKVVGAYPESESTSTSDRRSKTSRGVVPQRSYRSRSQERISRADYHNTGASAYEGSRPLARSRSRSRSSSKSNRHTLRDAALGAAIGTAAVSVAKSRHRDRSRSRNRSHSPRKARNRKSSSSESSIVDISKQAKTSVGGFGSFFSASSDNRRSRRRRRKSIFSFNNSSSSSLDNDLAFGSGYAKKLMGKPKRRGSKEKKEKGVDAKLLALGATATALAASSRQSRRTGELLGGQGSRSGRSDYTSSASNDDGWEDMDSEDQASTASSTLAFGASGHFAGDDSHSSDSSGSGWGWGWGNKSKKKAKRRSSPDNRFATGAAVAAGALGTAALASGYHRDAGQAPSSHTESLQHVAPMPTSDPSRFDALPVSSFPPAEPQLIRPGPIPLQHPQPVTPVSQAVYTTQGAPIQPFNAPIVPAFENPFPSYEAQSREVPEAQWNRESSGYHERINEAPTAERRHRRSDSTPIFNNIEPLEFTTGSGLKRRSTTKDQASVQFDLTREQEDKERRAERLERVKSDLEREERIQLIDRVEGNEPRNVGYVSQRYDERPREQEREREQAREQAREREREQERERRRERETEPERRFVKDDWEDKSSSSWVGPMAAGAIGAAAASTILSGRSSQDDSPETSGRRRERAEQRRAQRRSATDPTSISSMVSDSPGRPKHREVIEQRASSASPSDHVKTTAFRGVGRTKSVHDDYATFFYPEVLRHSPDSQSRRESPVMPTIVEIEPASEKSRQKRQPEEPRQQPEEPQLDYRALDRLPWPVPVLNVIEPTPPHSINGSVRDANSPIITPSEPPAVEEPERPTGSRVSWGEHQTHEYEVPSTSSERSSIDLDERHRDFASEDTTREAPIGYTYVAPSAEAGEDMTEDIEFAATLAAATQAAGFDPALITEDPIYRTRTSPPRSEIRDRSISPTTKVPLDTEKFQGFIVGEVETPEAPKQFFADRPIFAEPEPAVPESQVEWNRGFEGPTFDEQHVVEQVERVPTEVVDKEFPRSVSKPINVFDFEEKPTKERKRQQSDSPAEEEFFMPGGFEPEESSKSKRRSTSPVLEDAPRSTVSHSSTREPERLERIETDGAEDELDDIPDSTVADEGSDGKKKRRRKRRSKRDSDTFDDASSVTSSVFAGDSDKRRNTDDKGKKSGGFLSSIFGSRVSEPVESKRSPEKPVSREVQSEIGPRTSEESTRRRRHRSSSRGESLDERRYDDGPFDREDMTADKENINVESYKSSRQRREEKRRQRHGEMVGLGETEYEKEPRTSQDSDRDRSFLVERPEMPPTDDAGDYDGASGPSFSMDAEGRGLGGLGFIARRPRSHSTSPPSSEKIVTDSAPRSISPGPTLERGEDGGSRSRRPSMLRFVDSPTAVPLNFRPPPTSPRLQRSPSITSPTEASPSSPTQGRRSRPNSVEFKHSREIRPLFLVEQYGSSKIENQLDEALPSLPSSKSVSVEDLTNFPDENTWEMIGQPRQLFDTQHPTEEEYYTQQEILGSQQNTPTRGNFPIPRHLSRKAELGYEFHSPSELLQDLTSYPDLPPSPTTGILPSVEGSALGLKEDNDDFENLPPLPDSRPSTPENKAIGFSDTEQTTPTQKKIFPETEILGLRSDAGFEGVVDAAVAAVPPPSDLPYPDAESLAKSQSFFADDDDTARTVTGDDIPAVTDLSPPYSPITDNKDDYGIPAATGFTSVVGAAVTVAADKDKRGTEEDPTDFPVTVPGEEPADDVAETTEDEFFDAAGTPEASVSRDDVFGGEEGGRGFEDFPVQEIPAIFEPEPEPEDFGDRDVVIGEVEPEAVKTQPEESPLLEKEVPEITPELIEEKEEVKPAEQTMEAQPEPEPELKPETGDQEQEREQDPNPPSSSSKKNKKKKKKKGKTVDLGDQEDKVPEITGALGLESVEGVKTDEAPALDPAPAPTLEEGTVGEVDNSQSIPSEQPTVKDGQDFAESREIPGIDIAVSEQRIPSEEGPALTLEEGIERKVDVPQSIPSEQTIVEDGQDFEEAREIPAVDVTVPEQGISSEEAPTAEEALEKEHASSAEAAIASEQVPTIDRDQLFEESHATPAPEAVAFEVCPPAEDISTLPIIDEIPAPEQTPTLEKELDKEETKPELIPEAEPVETSKAVKLEPTQLEEPEHAADAGLSKKAKKKKKKAAAAAVMTLEAPVGDAGPVQGESAEPEVAATERDEQPVAFAEPAGESTRSIEHTEQPIDQSVASVPETPAEAIEAVESSGPPPQSTQDVLPEQSLDRVSEIEEVVEKQPAPESSEHAQDTTVGTVPALEETLEITPDATVNRELGDLEQDGTGVTSEEKKPEDEVVLPTEEVPADPEQGEPVLEESKPETEGEAVTESQSTLPEPDQEAQGLSSPTAIATPPTQTETIPEPTESKPERETLQPETETETPLSRKASKKNKKKNKRKSTAETLPEPESADSTTQPEASETVEREVEAPVLDGQEAKSKEQEDAPGEDKTILLEPESADITQPEASEMVEQEVGVPVLGDEEAQPKETEEIPGDDKEISAEPLKDWITVPLSTDDPQSAALEKAGQEVEAQPEDSTLKEQDDAAGDNQEISSEALKDEDASKELFLDPTDDPSPVTLEEKVEDALQEATEDQPKTKGKKGKKNRKSLSLSEPQPESGPETKPERTTDDVAAPLETSGQVPPLDDQQHHDAGTEKGPGSANTQTVDTIPGQADHELTQSVENLETNDSEPHVPERPTTEPEAGEPSTGKKNKKNKKKKKNKSIPSTPEESSIPDLVEAPETQIPATEAAPDADAAIDIPAPIEKSASDVNQEALDPADEMSRDKELPVEEVEVGNPVADDGAGPEQSPEVPMAAAQKKTKKDRKKKRQSVAPEEVEPVPSESAGDKEVAGALGEDAQEAEVVKGELEHSEAVTPVPEETVQEEQVLETVQEPAQEGHEQVQGEVAEQAPDATDEQAKDDQTAAAQPVIADETVATEVAEPEQPPTEGVEDVTEPATAVSTTEEPAGETQLTLEQQEDKAPEPEAPTVPEEAAAPATEDAPALEAEDKTKDIAVSIEAAAPEADDTPKEQPTESTLDAEALPETAVEPTEEPREQNTEEPQAVAETLPETPTEESQPTTSKKDKKKKKKKRQSISVDEPETAPAKENDVVESVDLSTPDVPVADDTPFESLAKDGEVSEIQLEPSTSTIQEPQESDKADEPPVTTQVTPETSIEEEQQPTLDESARELAIDQPTASQQEDITPTADDEPSESLPEEPISAPEPTEPQEQGQPTEEPQSSSSKKKNKKKKKKSQSSSVVVDKSTPAPASTAEEPVSEQPAESITESAVTAEPEDIATSVEEAQPLVEEPPVEEPIVPEKEVESQDVPPVEEETVTSKKKGKRDKKKRKSVAFATEEPTESAKSSEHAEPVISKPVEATESEQEVSRETKEPSENPTIPSEHIPESETAAEQTEQPKVEEPVSSNVPLTEAREVQESESKLEEPLEETLSAVAPQEPGETEEPKQDEEALAESLPQSVTEPIGDDLDKGDVAADETPTEELAQGVTDTMDPMKELITAPEAKPIKPAKDMGKQNETEASEPAALEPSSPVEAAGTAEPEASTTKSKKDKKKKKRKTLELKEEETPASPELSENVQDEPEATAATREVQEADEPAQEPEEQEEEPKSAKAKKKAKKDKKRQSKLLAFENEPSPSEGQPQDPTTPSEPAPAEELAPETSEEQPSVTGPETAISPAEDDGKEKQSHDTGFHASTDKDLSWTDNDVSSQVEKEQTVSTDPSRPEHNILDVDEAIVTAPAEATAAATDAEVVEERQEPSAGLESSGDVIGQEIDVDRVEVVPSQEPESKEQAEEVAGLEVEGPIEAETVDDKDLQRTLPEVTEPVEEPKGEEMTAQPTIEVEAEPEVQSVKEAEPSEPAADINVEASESAAPSRKLSQKHKKKQREAHEAQKAAAVQEQEVAETAPEETKELGDLATIEGQSSEPVVPEVVATTPEETALREGATETTPEDIQKSADLPAAEEQSPAPTIAEVPKETTTVPEEIIVQEETETTPEDRQNAADLPVEEPPTEHTVSEIVQDAPTLAEDLPQAEEVNDILTVETEPATADADTDKDRSLEIPTETIQEDEPLNVLALLPADENVIQEEVVVPESSKESPKEEVPPPVEDKPEEVLTGKSKKKNKKNKKKAGAQHLNASPATVPEPVLQTEAEATGEGSIEQDPDSTPFEPSAKELAKAITEVEAEASQSQVSELAAAALEIPAEEEQSKAIPEAALETPAEDNPFEPSAALEQPTLSRKESKKNKKKAKKLAKEQLEETSIPAATEAGVEDVAAETTFTEPSVAQGEPVEEEKTIMGENDEARQQDDGPVERAVTPGSAEMELAVPPEPAKEEEKKPEDEPAERALTPTVLQRDLAVLPEEPVQEEMVTEVAKHQEMEDEPVERTATPADTEANLAVLLEDLVQKEQMTEVVETQQKEDEPIERPVALIGTEIDSDKPQEAAVREKETGDVVQELVPEEQAAEIRLEVVEAVEATPASVSRKLSKKEKRKLNKQAAEVVEVQEEEPEPLAETAEPVKEDVSIPQAMLGETETTNEVEVPAEPVELAKEISIPTAMEGPRALAEAPNEEDLPLSRKVSKKEKKKRKGGKVEEPREGEQLAEPSNLHEEQPYEIVEPGEAREADTEGSHQDEDWPPIDWGKGKIDAVDQSSQSSVEAHAARFEPEIPEFKESAIPEALMERPGDTPQEVAKESKAQAITGTIDRDVTAREFTTSADALQTLHDVEKTEPKQSKIANLFPNLERGMFRRPSPTQSVKDGAEEETVEQASRDSAIQVLEAPIARKLALDTEMRGSSFKASGVLARDDVFGTTTRELPSMKANEPESRSVEHDTSDPVTPCDLQRTQSIHGRHDNQRLPWSLDEPQETERDLSPPRPLHPIAEQSDRAMVRDGTPQLEMKPEHVLPRPETPVRKFTETALGRRAWPTPENESDDDWEKVQKRTPSLSPVRGLRSEIVKTPEQDKPLLRPSSSGHSLRRVVHSASGDLRAAATIATTATTALAETGDEALSQSRPVTPQPQQQPPSLSRSPTDLNVERIASSSSYDPVTDKGKKPVRTMTDVYEGWGETPNSPRSPTRPPSIRHRRSMQHLQELEFRLDHLIAENRELAAARDVAENKLRNTSLARRKSDHALNTRDADLRDREAELDQLKQSVAWFQAEVARLNEENTGLTTTNVALVATHTQEIQTVQQTSTREMEHLRSQNERLSGNLHERIKQEIETAMGQKNNELRRLREELESARDKVKELQQQITASMNDDVIAFRGEEYFGAACQKLCGHVQQWILRFSKHSDHRRCRKLIDVQDEKIADRFDSAILDGSDTDSYLGDRVRRRDVFMSVVMTMVWEFIFTRYLFGMDREQRQKLKSLEKQLIEVGPRNAIHRWRATTLTLLSRRPAFTKQRESDTEAVALEIFDTLSRLLPPPNQVESQLLDSLRKVLRVAVSLSLEMRTQLAEFIMLPPLQPEYDTNGDLARQVLFNASLMNERSGETTSNDDLQSQQAVVRVVLFPLVVKKGNDAGEGEDEVVVCPAQVLVAQPGKERRLTKMTSGDRMSVEASRSVHSIAPSTMDMSMNMSMSNVI